MYGEASLVPHPQYSRPPFNPPPPGSGEDRSRSAKVDDRRSVVSTLSSIIVSEILLTRTEDRPFFNLLNAFDRLLKLVEDQYVYGPEEGPCNIKAFELLPLSIKRCNTLRGSRHRRFWQKVENARRKERASLR